MELQGTIGTTLEYFFELSTRHVYSITPGESLVLQTDFLYMVERVDICIEFLKSHLRSFFSVRLPQVLLTHLYLAFLEMSDPRDDTHQNVLRWLASRAHTGYLAMTSWAGA